MTALRRELAFAWAIIAIAYVAFALERAADSQWVLFAVDVLFVGWSIFTARRHWKQQARS